MEIEEKYVGEFEDLIYTIDKLKEAFPKISFDFDFIAGNLQKFQVVCNDFDFYMKDKRFKAWRQVFYKRFPKLRVFYVFRHG